ncbi:MAG TPA: dephospho-CoA kinase [Candidatus Acidoferrum sp.]|nr:dephospho-CoA kinase [Candidatus Acidoferrum sp.]
MLRIGLTGGIASGKSTVAKMLRARDCLVLEADPLGHEFLEPGQKAYAEVVREFGTEILMSGGIVDRAKLGDIVFADSARLARLNQILHPPILQVIRTWFGALDRMGGPPLAFVEAALILEAGFNQELDKVVVCWCSRQQQMERLQARGLTPREAEMRIASQMPIDEKRRRADEVIDCSVSIAETEQQVDRVLARLREAAK